MSCSVNYLLLSPHSSERNTPKGLASEAEQGFLAVQLQDSAKAPEYEDLPGDARPDQKFTRSEKGRGFIPCIERRGL